MKIRIGAVGGLGSIGRSLDPDALDPADAGVVPPDPAALTVDETTVLNDLAAATVSDAIDRAEAPASAARVANRGAMAATAMLAQERSTLEAALQAKGIAQTPQGLSDNVLDGVIAASAKWASTTYPAADGDVPGANAGADPIATQASVAAPPETSFLPPLHDSTASTPGAVDGGQAGQHGSQSDQEQSGGSNQSVWADTAPGADKTVLTYYQAPLFNRRLETNGVDDALTLATKAALRDALNVRNVQVPPVQPIAAVTRPALVAADHPEDAAQAALRTKARSRETKPAEPPASRWRQVAVRRRHYHRHKARLAHLTKNVVLPALVRRGASTPDQEHGYRPWQPPKRRNQLRKSDQRDTGVAECAACWVGADRSVFPVQIAERTSLSAIAEVVLQPVGLQHLHAG